MNATIVPSTLLDYDTLPTSPAQVWDLSRVFAAYWNSGIKISTTWDTDITPAGTASERRTGLSGKPVRTMQVDLRSFQTREAWQLYQMLRRFNYCRTVMPLYSDCAPCTGDNVGTRIYCHTSFRRFFLGGRVAVASLKHTRAGLGPEMAAFGTAIITAIHDDGLTLDTELAASYGAKVWPLIEVEVGAQSNLSLTTDRVGSVNLMVKEVPGASALPPLAEYGDDIGWPIYNSLPVLEPNIAGDPTRFSMGWTRNYRTTATGLGNVVTTMDTRPRAVRSFAYRPYSRAAAWSIMELFDAQCGELHPLYFVNPATLFDVVNMPSTSSVRVVSSGPLSDYRDNPFMAFKKYYSTDVYIRGITAFSRSGGIDTLTLNAALPFSSANSIRKITTACLGRFDSTGITESWLNGSICSLDFNAVELINEHTVTF